MFTACQSGYYGNKCERSCSGHCLNKLVCDHIDGACSEGCEDGYMDKLCNTCKIFHCASYLISGYSFAKLMPIWHVLGYVFIQFSIFIYWFYRQNC